MLISIDDETREATPQEAARVREAQLDAAQQEHNNNDE